VEDLVVEDLRRSSRLLLLPLEHTELLLLPSRGFADTLVAEDLAVVEDLRREVTLSSVVEVPTRDVVEETVMVDAA